MTYLSPDREAAYCRRQLERLNDERFPSTTRAERRARLLGHLEEAEKAAAAVRCSRCGAVLTDPVSIARRMGECCAAKRQVA